ncbi:MAG: sulfatase [Planctomycetes bacterium]|nr:sulfatase [Planctomycetota bacterium]
MPRVGPRRVLLALFLAAACAPDRPRPNIVLVLADDLGWKDVSYNGSAYSTPHIDRLAAQGLTFTQAYAATPACSPTRAALLTGRSPARLGITRAIRGKDYREEGEFTTHVPGWPWPCLPYPSATHLADGVPTFADRLRAAGYETAYIGKWHLGRGADGPARHGFEHASFVGSVGASNYYPPYQVDAAGPTRSDAYLTDRLTDEAVAFLEREHERPFCLVLAHFAVHEPIQAKPELVRALAPQLVTGSAQSSANYAAMLWSLDESVGRVLTTLSEQGLEDETLVVFTSDNGPLLERGERLTTVAPLRGGKLELYEGGIRVPLVVRWPGQIATGATTPVPSISMDLYPTLLRAAGVELAPEDSPGFPPDGLDLAPLWHGAQGLARERLHFFVPHREAQAAIRAGDWKLVHWFGGRSELYDLARDVGEQYDLAAAEPQRARALEAELLAWIRASGAPLPELNPEYDPAQPPSAHDEDE